MSRPSRSLRLTRDGGVVACGAALLLFAGFWAANNLLLLIAAPLCALLVLSLGLGWWNLRRITVERALPRELYAGREAFGRLIVANGRRWAATDLVLYDVGTTAHGAIGRVAGRAARPVRTGWRFAERGVNELTAVRVLSRWPFALSEHAVVLAVPGQAVAYPRPIPSPLAARPWSGALGAEPDAAGHGTGDFLGLRPYRPGDSPRRVHWPTSARIGSLLVSERAGETEVSVEVVVRPHTGPLWERELSVAAGEVLRALHTGRKVGLALPAVDGHPARRLPPGSGEAWRRTLLEALALLPRRE